MNESPIELVGETDRLFALDPGEFVAARNDLVRRLKAAGATEAAERTRRLARPTKAAWALNHLARTAPDAVRELSAAGEGLREAQDALLSGSGTVAALQEAERRGRQAIAAAELALPRDLGSALEGVRGALRAALVDAEAGAELAAGHLSCEPEPPGLSGPVLAAAPVAPPPPTPAPPSPPPLRPAPDPETLVEAREAVDRAGQAVVAATQEATVAAQRVAEAEDAEERATEALQMAERDLMQARREHQRAVGERAQAVAAAEEARGAHAAAEEARAAAQADLERAAADAQAILGDGA